MKLSTAATIAAASPADSTGLTISIRGLRWRLCPLRATAEAYLRGRLGLYSCACAARDPYCRGPVRSVLARVQRRRNARRPARDVWERGLPSETGYWEKWIARRGDPDPGRLTDSFEWRLDPESEVQEPLRGVLDRLEGPAVSILDVGAGPLTSVGKRHPGKQIEVVAIDPLAAEYDALLERAGIEPPVRTRPGRAELLLQEFGAGAFDVAHADNALDHCADPVAAIEEMFAVVRPGGYVVLRHGPNEAERNHYRGLHQWNLEASGDRLVVWGRGESHDVGSRLGPAAELRNEMRGHDLVTVIAKSP